ncbi:MAG: hypothetical protein UHM08_04415 [Bacteroidales bacterium]|nr:hypothetical protein [Bacteroidales bacterium]
MKKEDLKPKIQAFLHQMMSEWFPDKNVLRGLGNALIDANVNKYDNILDMFADEKGEIDVEDIIKNMDDTIEIDLQSLSPILPNRILLITKNDLMRML